MRARLFHAIGALGLAGALSGCYPAGYSACYQVDCPAAPAHPYGYAGNAPGRYVADEPSFDNPFNDYTQRSLTIASGAGNAEAANTALQTSTPWPRYSNNTNIPGNGASTVRAVKEFESGTRETETAKRTLQPTSGGGGAGIEINNGGGGGSQTTGQ
jgi:hypothetical protein